MLNRDINLIHCSYHKCLTKYFARTFKGVLNRSVLKKENYKHFNSHIGEFYENIPKYRVISVNNHSLDFDRLGKDYRITRFIRDPRDLIVSGYFYHKRGAEDWCKIISPTDKDWVAVNGTVPTGMKKNESYQEMLSRLNCEKGLIAEIEFRKKHFESMRRWPKRDKRIRLYKYEELLGNENQIYQDIFEFYELNTFDTLLGKYYAMKNSAGKGFGGNKHIKEHIRNPSMGQWKNYFTPEVNNIFNDLYGDVLEFYGYNSD